MIQYDLELPPFSLSLGLLIEFCLLITDVFLVIRCVTLQLNLFENKLVLLGKELMLLSMNYESGPCIFVLFKFAFNL